MSSLDHIHDALSALYPGIHFSEYMWVSTPSGPQMREWDEARFGPFDIDLVTSKCAEIALAKDRQRLKDAVAAERFARLNNIQYDGRVFCMTDDKFALVDIWRAGAKRTEEIAPGAWTNKTWAHMSDGQGGYVVTDWAACDAWSYQMFVSVASVTNAADAHNLAIDSLTTQEEIDNYDTSTNWPS